MDMLPKARTDVQITPAIVQGRQVIAVRDMVGLMDGVVMLAPSMLSILPLFDGQHSFQDLQMVLMRQRGNQLVMLDEVQKLVHDMDQMLLLETDRYHTKKRELIDTFLSLDHRPTSHAGTAYPEDPSALKSMLEDILSSAENNSIKNHEPIRALIAPHIDLKLGRNLYAKAYGALKGTQPKRLIVMGTGHSVGDALFSFTTKDYVTPLGSFPTDRDAVRKLQKACGSAASPDDFAHRNEHAIEFQMVFLRYVLEHEIPVVPILFGTLEPYLTNVERPCDIPEVAGFIETLSKLVDKETLIIAGVDLSHVGPKFGHPQAATFYETEFKAHDNALLEALCMGSPTAFWAEGRRVQDRYHVCGFPVLACLLELLPGLSGRVLDYHIWHEDQTRSAVSFAAALIVNEQ